MASEIMNEILTEDKLVQMWPDFQCLYDVQSPAFKNRDLRHPAKRVDVQTVVLSEHLRVLRVKFSDQI